MEQNFSNHASELVGDHHVERELSSDEIPRLNILPMVRNNEPAID